MASNLTVFTTQLAQEWVTCAWIDVELAPKTVHGLLVAAEQSTVDIHFLAVPEVWNRSPLAMHLAMCIFSIMVVSLGILMILHWVLIVPCCTLIVLLRRKVVMGALERMCFEAR
jgi:hypothetical protein